MDDLAIKMKTRTRMAFASFAAFYLSRPDGEKWELIDGEALMMAPPAHMHQRIRRNIETLINNRLAVARPEWEADSEIGVHVPEDDDWSPEPDITVTDSRIPSGQIYAERFYFVVEVLSSDRADVLAKKRAYYKAHQHNRGFMFVSQAAVSVEVVRRGNAGWTTIVVSDPDATIDLPDIGEIGKLRQFYRSTELEPK